MFIKKIIKIKNVGQIKDYVDANNIEFKKFNTIFGENAVGKTTLSTIFRSLKTGNTTGIEIKKTIGAPAPTLQEIEIKTNNGNIDKDISYDKSSGWGADIIPEIEIFDSYFIEKNVLSGYQVGLEHQQNLPNLILGEEGIKQVLLLEQYKKDLATTIPQKENELKVKITGKVMAFNEFLPYGTKSEEFLKKFFEMPKPSEPDYDYDKNIQDTSNNIKVLCALVNNPNQQPFQLLEIPAFDKDNFVNNVLHKTLSTISTEAEKKVKAHAKNFDMPDAAWLVKGREFLSGKDTCPFCSQSIRGIDLVDIYKSYFSKEYNEFRKELINYQEFEVFNQVKMLEAINTIINNNNLRKVFQGGITDVWPTINMEKFENTISSLYTMLTETYSKKKVAILESIDLPEETEEMFTACKELVSKLEEYNKAITASNEQLKELSNEPSKQLEVAEKRLLKLILTKARYTELNDLAENEVLPLIEMRKTVTAQNKALQTSFRTDATTFKKKYETSINSYLEKFGANFRIQIAGPNYRSSKPSYDFGVIIDGNTSKPIPARPRDSTDTEQCIGNALSEGDKTTLAFTFFLAKLNQDETVLTNKIVVIDDPISSLDKHRRTQTIDMMTGLLPKISQLFILSHDEFFLDYCMKYKSSTTKAEKMSCEVKRSGSSGSEIRMCNLKEYVKNRYQRSYDLLVSYYDNPSNYDNAIIIPKIRTYLEGLLQSLYPQDFSSDDTLGVYIGKIRGGATHALNRILSDLTTLNAFATPDSHCSDQPIPTDAETQTMVNAALSIVNKITTPDSPISTETEQHKVQNLTKDNLPDFTL